MKSFVCVRAILELKKSPLDKFLVLNLGIVILGVQNPV